MKKGNAFLRFGVPLVVATGMLVLASFQTRPATLNAAPTAQVYVTNSGAAQAIPTAA